MTNLNEAAVFPIQFRLSNYRDQSEKIIRESAGVLSVPEEIISSVIVAADSSDDYAASIKGCRGYVGGGTHSPGGAGKTVPFKTDNGTVRSDVVYPASTLTALFCYSHDAPTYFLSRYAIVHEFGHVLDNNARSVLSPPPLYGYERTIEDYAPYYGAILLSEFAATFIAGGAITNRQYAAIADNARNSIEDVIGQGRRLGNQLPWYILSQEVQVTGTALGMIGSSQPTMVRWKGINEQTERELSTWTDVLGELKAKYPAWDTAASLALFTERCESFARTLRD